MWRYLSFSKIMILLQSTFPLIWIMLNPNRFPMAVLCKGLRCSRVAPDPCVGAHLAGFCWPKMAKLVYNYTKQG